MTAEVIVDGVGAQMGGAGRYLDEPCGYLARIGREDVEIIGSRRGIGPDWPARRELNDGGRSRGVAFKNAGVSTHGGQRWTLQRNAPHFRTGGEQARLDPAHRAFVRDDALVVVHLAVRRSDGIVAPCIAIAKRIAAAVASAGAFPPGILLSAFHAALFARFVAIASASGLSARSAAERNDLEKAVPGADALISDPDIEVVVMATPHDLPADLTTLTLDEPDAVEKAWRGSGRQLAVGFNRRWSPSALAAQQALARVAAHNLPMHRVAGSRERGPPYGLTAILTSGVSEHLKLQHYRKPEHLASYCQVQQPISSI